MDNLSDGNKKIARNTVFLYLRMGVVLCITLYTSREILSVLGVDDYGTFNVVAGFVTMFAFLNSSLANCAQRFYNYENGKNGEGGFTEVFNASMLLQLLMAVVVALLVECVGVWYINNKLVIGPSRVYAAYVVFQTSLCSLVLVILQVPFLSAIIAKEKMDFFAFVGVLEASLKLLIVILLKCYSQDKLILYSYLYLVVTIIITAILVSFATKRITQIKIHTRYNIELIRNMVFFTGWNSLASFTQVTKVQGVNVVMNLFFGPVVNAASGLAFQIKSALLGFVLNISTAARPQITENYSIGNVLRSNSIVYIISKLSFVMLFMVVIPVILEADLILNLWLGNNVPNYTRTFLVLILSFTLIDIVQSPLGIIINASGRIKWFNICISAIEIAMLPLSYFALSLGASPNMVFLIGVFDSLAMLLASIYFYHIIIGVRYIEYAQKVLIPISAMIIPSVICPYFVRHSLETGMIRLMLVSLTSIITTAFVGYYFLLNIEEKKTVMLFLKSKLTR